MTIDEIKLRRVASQHLITPVGKLTVARDLNGVQAQFMSNALHALKIRSNEIIKGDGLVKNWTIRGTVHVFAADDLPLYKYNARAHLISPADAVKGDRFVTDERKRMFAELIIAKIAEGVDERGALKDACNEAGMTERESGVIFDSWGGTIRDLCECGFICHGIGERKTFIIAPPFVPMEPETARLEIARRYFTNFGPCTLRDASYYFGCPQAQVKTWLAKLPVTPVMCGKTEYFFIENGANLSHRIPRVLFLAGFDQLMLGYQKLDSLFLPKEYLRGIFNLAGIVMPALMLDGTVAAKWKLKSRRLEIRPFREITQEERSRVADEAERLWDGENGGNTGASIEKIEYVL